ncbi:MAG: MATE family efflux transporter [Chloroflexi bacterium AL-W]|nr:MATE family efflux transporter [Chloroflexi bacterium AL-N1]NOK67419.1 MATE family efflux transporter [Chloroflexi bacterium AL-N10]NOK75089.1 MATE family efflux transporter [Chloroflexi bacterium AL-N5]NOK81876.1 MATE family efflux transporter [Chloroflexi bacterium AL-W]NOK89722.1 MATE family efflux transporter [Chloroflexi bacterium AL-N15]
MNTSSSDRDTTQPSPQDHPFVRKPHRTVLFLAIPVLFSLIAEPLTGLVDTAFVAQLGNVSLSALGVGTTALTSIFWIFNFLQIGTQTEVARHIGRDEQQKATQISGLALSLAVLFGVLIIAITLPTLGLIASAMGATGAVYDQAITYMQFRIFGAPAILLMLTAFGVLRGLQDMRTPLWVAVGVNMLNIILDPLFIFGWGALPPLGVGGAALASTLSQWVGAVWIVGVIVARLGIPNRLQFDEVGRLLQVGGDLFLRTGLLTLFLILGTRTATQIGPDAGGAHQAIRQFWVFAALFLDTFAITGQSLISYFLGAGWMAQARRVATIICLWSLGTGVMLGLVMLVGQDIIAQFLVPTNSQSRFFSAWIVAALIQPLNALTFATDGIHWGTGDYGFLRNAMFAATIPCGLALLLLDQHTPDALVCVWVISGVWSMIRAFFGIVRIWPGWWGSPLAQT